MALTSPIRYHGGTLSYSRPPATSAPCILPTPRKALPDHASPSSSPLTVSFHRYCICTSLRLMNGVASVLCSNFSSGPFNGILLPSQSALLDGPGLRTHTSGHPVARPYVLSSKVEHSGGRVGERTTACTEDPQTQHATGSCLPHCLSSRKKE